MLPKVFGDRLNFNPNHDVNSDSAEMLKPIDGRTRGLPSEDPPPLHAGLSGENRRNLQRRLRTLDSLVGGECRDSEMQKLAWPVPNLAPLAAGLSRENIGIRDKRRAR